MLKDVAQSGRALAAQSRDTTGLVDALCRCVAECESAVVAFSAGVDSTVVLKVAALALDGRALAVTGISPSLAADEAADAERLALAIGVPLLALPTGELDNPDYAANAPDRCFHCKTGLYALCRRVAGERGLRCILNGTNRDDLGDWRPGLAAAERAGVLSPLLQCGLGKSEVRMVARHLGLPNWDKPALACLASRLPYGTAVTAQRLAAVERVERHLRTLGFREVRARHHGDEVRLEVEPDRVDQLLALAADDAGAAGAALADTVRAAGFTRLSVEREGFRSGRLNAGVPRGS